MNPSIHRRRHRMDRKLAAWAASGLADRGTSFQRN